MASAFISYAHEDQEFVLALVEHLQGQGLDISYDRVVLQIGDSLIQTISRVIAEGDFLIAIVSPDSVESGWCRRELSLAATQGINERRVKVLPVKFRGATMPPMLQDIYWADADTDSIETIARRLTAAIRAHLEGREADAAREAEEAEEADGDRAHAEMVGDVTVAQLEEVAQRVWDVFDDWGRMWDGGNIRDLQASQRRLRWALDNLPARVRAGLPLVEQLARAGWDDFFGAIEADAVEPDLREEMRSVRTQVAQGLAVTRRWTITDDLGQISAGRRDAVSYLWRIARGEETRNIQVFISGMVMAFDEGLPREVAQAKGTNGRSVVATLVALDDPPDQVSVTAAGVSLTLPD